MTGDHAALDLADGARAWLVHQDLDATPDSVGRALQAMGVVAEPLLLADLVDQVLAHLVGLGPLARLIAGQGVTDVLVNGAGSVWVDDGRGLRPADVALGDESGVRLLAQRLAAQAGRRLDDAQPFVDARLPGGIRLHAALAPVAAPGTLISLRIPARGSFDLAGLVRAGAVSVRGAEWLRAMVAARLAFLVVGGTGSGKTTVLRALIEQIPRTERVLIIEESAELEPRHGHCVRMECRTDNAESAGAITLSDLMRQAMRMRPDRIVVGEVRGAEITQLLAAMNTGHEGCCGTIHANSPEAVPARIEALALAAGLNREAVHSQVAAGLDVVLLVDRDGSGHRRIATMGVAAGNAGGTVAIVPLLTFTDDRPLLHAPGHPVAARLLAALGRRAAA